ncbi:MAG TPA: hypothetical protein VMY35_17250 [Phycisphaerae bacterium]|nr:hypothetical protein [Phycisphaerae bacterium]
MADNAGEQVSAQEAQGESVQDEVPSFIEPNGTFKEGWMDAFVPEDLRHLGDYKPITTVAQLAKEFGHAKTLIGRQGKGIMPLTEDATQTERDAYYEALGRPPTPDEYTITPPKDMEDVFDAVALKDTLPVLHGLGLTQKQVQGVVNLDAERVKEAMAKNEAAVKTAYEEGLKTLKTEWGDAFKQKMHQAKSVIAQSVPAEKEAELLERWGNDLDLVRALSTMGELLLEDTMADAGGAGTRPMTPDELENKAKELMQTPGYIEGRLPEAKQERLRKEIHALYEQAGVARAEA